MKKIISLLVSFTMLLSIVSVVDFSAFADTLTTGKCGENVTYSFDESTGVLTISGTGDMSQWPEDDSPWYGNTHIKTLIIDEGVTSIGARAFQSCSNLSNVQLPNSLISIDSEAFYNCRSLTNITIPNGVSKINHSAFESCTNLTSFNVNAGNSNYSSQDGVLFNKDKTELIQYPVGNERTTYDIPNSVRSIGDYAFSKCANLSNVTIPSSVTNIGDFAFQDCTSLTSVNIPNSVKTIGGDTFSGCTNLTSVTIGNGVTSIDFTPFFDCSNLNEIIYNGTTSQWTSIQGYINVSIPVKCTDGVFKNVVTIDSLKYEFSDNTASITGYTGTIKDLAIPESIYYEDRTFEVTKIGDSAFEGCTSLTNVTIPDSVTSIGAFAFDECTNLTNVYYGGSQDDWNKIDIGRGNKFLTDATIHCSLPPTPEPEPTPTPTPEPGPTPSPAPSPTPSPSPAPTPTQPTTTTKTTSAKVVSKPKSAKIKKVKAAKKAVSVEWKKVSGVNGYEIQVATDKKFKKNKKTVTVKKQKTTKVTVKKLKAKKKYYVRIRTYKTVKGKKVYSSWSKVKTVKTK